jgi:hypothetical protein
LQSNAKTTSASTTDLFNFCLKEINNNNYNNNNSNNKQQENLHTASSIDISSRSSEQTSIASAVSAHISSCFLYSQSKFNNNQPNREADRQQMGIKLSILDYFASKEDNPKSSLLHRKQNEPATRADTSRSEFYLQLSDDENRVIESQREHQRDDNCENQAPAKKVLKLVRKPKQKQPKKFNIDEIVVYRPRKKVNFFIVFFF